MSRHFFVPYWDMFAPYAHIKRKEATASVSQPLIYINKV